MGDLEVYKSRFDERGWRVFVSAIEESRLRGQNYVCLEHVIKHLANEERDLFNGVFQNLGVAPNVFNAAVERCIDAAPRHAGQGAQLDQDVIETLKRALGWAHWRGRDRISTVDILVALSQEEQGPFIKIFTALGVVPLTAITTVRDTATEYERQSQKDATGLSTNDNSFTYKKGDTVRIKGGAFSSMTAKVTGANPERSTVMAAVRIFGRSKIIELGSSDVEKISFEQTYS